MTWLWINPQSEPEEMVEAVDRAVSPPTKSYILTEAELDSEYQDSDVGFDIANAYNEAEKIGVFPAQTDKDGKPYFSDFSD